MRAPSGTWEPRRRHSLHPAGGRSPEAGWLHLRLGSHRDHGALALRSALGANSPRAFEWSRPKLASDGGLRTRHAVEEAGSVEAPRVTRGARDIRRSSSEAPWRSSSPSVPHSPHVRGTLPNALVIASDLQGVANAASGETRLVGQVLAEQLTMLAARGSIPPLPRTGVILAGDLYSAPEANQRGASGR